MAIDIIFELIEKGNYDLYWSFILEDENSSNPFLNRRSYIKLLSSICSVAISPTPQIKEVAKIIIDNSNARIKDALHIATAAFAGCEYFITCDDRLIRTLNSNMDNIQYVLNNIKLFNPVEFLRKEMKINVIE
ncbi:PIN domain-containing protein [Herbivorax sp. ANBcel31]|uniref:PIN domain-containing protein n=1 Tax=Herbivorax sp. ANBcel31 TaxID=3069754 RepID=UPI0027B81AAB|nr:PIN domain-containing protein [Herbivorax sp. ANBcel31]MDQ2087667.1 PIN domain-containing protein [Herbivorax sp. ANBcel31]